MLVLLFISPGISVIDDPIEFLSIRNKTDKYVEIFAYVITHGSV